jgi:transcriptional regulator with XRE-family HTH domain
VSKRTFGDIVRTARVEKGLSLRSLAGRAGVDYSRLARIEQGTRPSPDLATTRRLAELLDLDLATLLVSAGTSREVLEGIVWSERRDLGKRHRILAEYDPRDSALRRKNRFEVTVRERDGTRCIVRLGRFELPVFSFSTAKRLQIVIPPEAVTVFADDPRPALGSAESVLPMRILKARQLGSTVNLVLGGAGFEINALLSAETCRSAEHEVGCDVWALIPAAAIRTSPIEEET